MLTVLSYKQSFLAFRFFLLALRAKRAYTSLSWSRLIRMIMSSRFSVRGSLTKVSLIYNIKIITRNHKIGKTFRLRLDY